MFRSWVGSLFSRHAFTRRNPKQRLRLMALENRVTPANNITIQTGGLSSIPAGATTFADTSNYTIDPSALTNSVTSISLKANVDIFALNSFSMSAAGVNLSAQAKRDIRVDNSATIYTGNNYLLLSADRTVSVEVGCTLTSTTGDITLLGNATGSTNASSNGVIMNGTAWTTGAGNIVINGHGGNASALDRVRGVFVFGGKILATGGGAISITGIGGDGGTNNCVGISLESNAIVFSTAGKITLNGTGGNGTEDSNIGVVVVSGAAVTAVNNAALDIVANGGDGSNQNAGLGMASSGKISSFNGDISIQGSASDATGINNNGVWLLLSASIATTGAGNLTITGSTAEGSADGIRLETSTAINLSGPDNVFVADSIGINAPINAGSNRVTLRPASTGIVIDVGASDVAAGLELSDSELDQITAAVLQIGDAAQSNPIIVSAAISSSNYATLALATTSSISESNSGFVGVSNLALRAGIGIGSASVFTTNVDNLAYDFTSGLVNITNNSPLNITNVDGLTSSKSAGSTQLVANGSITIASDVYCDATLFIHAIDNPTPVSDNITLVGGFTVDSNLGDIYLYAGDDLTINSGSSLYAFGSIYAYIDYADADPGDGATANINGPISSAGMNVTGGLDADQFFVAPSTGSTINVNGDLPDPPSTGDFLSVDVTGTTDFNLNATPSATGFSGEYSFGNRQPVTFQRIESFLPSGTDLSVTADNGVTSAIPGSIVEYTVVVTNNGPNPVVGAVFKSFVSSFLTGITYGRMATGGATGGLVSGSGDVTDTLDMPVGSTVTYTFHATIMSSATIKIGSLFTIETPAGQPDIDLSNNEAFDSDTLTPEADLHITMVDSPDPVQVGGNITYTITVTNGGLSDAQSLLFTNTLPLQTTFVSFTAAPGWIAMTPPPGLTGQVTAIRPSLQAGEGPQVFTLVVRVNGTTPANVSIQNQASVTSTTNNPIPGDNTVTANTNTTTALLPMIVGAGAGTQPTVQVFDPTTGAQHFGFLAYDASFSGGVRVAAGDVTGDGVPDILTAAGPGGGPHVKVFDGITGAVVRSFFAYSAAFTGGVFIASGDVNNDGFKDIITGADAGGGPHVRVFSGKTGKIVTEFFAYSASFLGGVRVAAGDIDGDGRADIVTGAGPGGGPHVEAFSGATGQLIRSFFAYDARFSGGVFVAAGDMNNDGKADIITGPGSGALPAIIFSGLNLATLASVNAYGAFAGGVRVGVANVNADNQLDLVTGAGPGGGPHVQAFDGVSLARLKSFYAFDPSFTGGVYVG